ncbi:MAG: hypothetical protein ABIH76_01635 [Candidatus Bathyarchaeota archaeon]
MPLPYVNKQSIKKIGGSTYILVPPEWLKGNEINPENVKELLVVADKDMRVVNPEHEKEVYDEVTGITRRVKV